MDNLGRYEDALRRIVWAENRGPDGAAESAYMVQVARDALAEPPPAQGAVSDLESAVRLLDNARTTIIDSELRCEWEAERARLRRVVDGLRRV